MSALITLKLTAASALDMDLFTLCLNKLLIAFIILFVAAMLHAKQTSGIKTIKDSNTRENVRRNGILDKVS